MKKAILAAVIATAMAVTLCGCGGSAGSSSSSSSAAESSSSASSSGSAATQATSDTYESIFDDYSAQLEAEAPVLVDEYNAEAANLTDVQAKAQLSNDKISELAKISTEGTEKMAEVMMKNGDDYSTYEDWANQLNDVYMAQSQLITDAYMASAV